MKASEPAECKSLVRDVVVVVVVVVVVIIITIIKKIIFKCYPVKEIYYP
jgi:hypothetical protein